MASATWIASSRVGVRISAWGARTAGSIRDSSGSANAAVLPVPVWARPRTSRPSSSSGMVSVWIGVGVVKPWSTRVPSTRSSRPSATKPFTGSASGASRRRRWARRRPWSGRRRRRSPEERVEREIGVGQDSSVGHRTLSRMGYGGRLELSADLLTRGPSQADSSAPSVTSSTRDGPRRRPVTHGRIPSPRASGMRYFLPDLALSTAFWSVESAATKASCGTSTRPIVFIRFLPSFCFSSSLRLRVMSPP